MSFPALFLHRRPRRYNGRCEARGFKGNLRILSGTLLFMSSRSPRASNNFEGVVADEKQRKNRSGLLRALHGLLMIPSQSMHLWFPLDSFPFAHPSFMRVDALCLASSAFPSRYFSQLRMVMCKKTPDEGYASLEEEIEKHFHAPGEAKEYLERVSVQSLGLNPLEKGLIVRHTFRLELCQTFCVPCLKHERTATRAQNPTASWH